MRKTKPHLYLYQANKPCPYLHEIKQGTIFKRPLKDDLHIHTYRWLKYIPGTVQNSHDMTQYLSSWTKLESSHDSYSLSKQNYPEIFIVLLSDFFVLLRNLLHVAIVLGGIQQWWTLLMMAATTTIMTIIKTDMPTVMEQWWQKVHHKFE